MPFRPLRKIFSPKSVAVIGASSRVGSVGERVIANLISTDFSGPVVPINPAHDAVHGLNCVSRISDVPHAVDLAVLCTPADATPDVVDQCGKAGVGGLICLSDGFREIGPIGRGREDELKTVLAKYPRMRMIGPNCLGVIRPPVGLNASFATDVVQKGNVAFLSQSAAFCASILDRAASEGIGFSCVVSVGNMVNVTMADLIDHLAFDPHTDAIVIYLQSLADARRFMSAARAFTRYKPIIACKAGRYHQSAIAAASHTGAMVGIDAVYDAAFARAGIVRVDQAEDLWGCAELLTRYPNRCGSRLGILTNAGGPGVMAVDALMRCRGQLAKLDPQRRNAMDELFPSGWSRDNPAVVFGDTDPVHYSEAADVMLADHGVDALLAILVPQPLTDPDQTARRIADVAKAHRKPLIACWMGGSRAASGAKWLHDHDIAVYSSPEKAVTAFGHLVHYGRRYDLLYETPKAAPPVVVSDDRTVDDLLGGEGDAAEKQSSQVWSELRSKRLLAAYGIDVTMPQVVRSANEAIAVADAMGYPVAVKVYAPELTHKTDVGGVVLNVSNAEQVAEAYQTIHQRSAQARPDIQVRGVTVQPMLVDPLGRELIVGAKRDPVFGAVLMVGAGGIDAELFQDSAVELPPLSESLSRRLLEQLQCRPMLDAYRGRPPIDMDALQDALIRISHMVAQHPEVIELDINPLVVTPTRTIALDATVLVDHDWKPIAPGDFPHLAIRPYPDRWIRADRLSDGTEVTLRPIRPEDEEAWTRMLATCSQETIRLRFRYLFKQVEHEMAARYCFIDYDRELALVAEYHPPAQSDDPAIAGSESCLIGVGRLVADAENHEAEFAVMVHDRWQGRRLGSILTDRCLEIAKQRGLQKIVAETATENRAMRTIFQNRGFQCRRIIGDDTLIFTLDMSDANADAESKQA
ncbi:bifunctional acetate--CoA ligase family protein/GNAT family N-acetyltransferase [Crateriforma conspicua]|uniref:bifunctional acetate--CoA ligase family protein/GNAT family N-acetyltransferase n=1 Tax=Crateriforma conspicua TaxID=2527996 RepID=UPI00118B4C1A|nr:bifunctional acetate--CoA ligase family protein/GNAT family N-acetyltransferase [Crateriforma conspicua]QDV64697.1 succinyl-CoA synthetase subunit alpha [Crateriforma conspicua]